MGMGEVEQLLFYAFQFPELIDSLQSVWAQLESRVMRELSFIIEGM
jgi:hypothetical protein